jgi:hypothetical protein
MFQTKLVRILKTLSESDMVKLGYMVDSPYFNTDANVRALYHTLYAAYPSFVDPKLGYEELYINLVPGELRDKNSIILSTHRILNLVEKHILIKSQLIDPLMRHYAMLTHLSSFDLGDDLDGYFQEAEDIAANTVWNIGEKALWFFKIEQLKSQILTITNKEASDTAHKTSIGHLNQYVATQYLLAHAWVLSRQSAFVINTSVLNPYELVNILNIDNGLFADDKTKICLEISRIFSHQSIDSYHYIKNLLLGGGSSLSVDNERMLFAYLENATQLLFERGPEQYNQIFDLYKYQISSGAIISKNTIKDTGFRNIVTVAILVGELDWCNKFINKYAKYLPAEDGARNGVRKICLAMVAFELKDWDLAVKHLKGISSINIMRKLDERRIRMKIYYEMGEKTMLLSFIDSFRKFLKDYRKQLADYPIELHRNFISAISDMMHAVHAKPDILHKLYERIASNKNITERAWLLSKVQILIDNAQKPKK